MIIEQARSEDAEEILALQKIAFRGEAKQYYDDAPLPPLTQTVEDTRSDFEKKLFLKAVTNKRIVGSVRAFTDGGTCYIEKLVIHPDFQNQGIGTELMNEIEERFKDVNRFEIFTGNKSKKTIYLYQKLGYKSFEEKPVDNSHSLVFMEKPID